MDANIANAVIDGLIILWLAVFAVALALDIRKS